MLRIVHRSIFPGMLLTACVIFVCTGTAKANQGASAENKQMYSNRPLGFTVPTPYYGSPMAPRFVAPSAPVRVVSPVVPVVPAVPRVPAVREIAVPGAVSPSVVASAPIAVTPPAPQIARDTVFILREQKPEVNVNDELDVFYARLAKIQLEKRQINDTLALIRNIKSETFRVRTLVDLAEYVSRDRNYLTEAELLYRLALEAIESLNKRQPVRIEPAATPSPVVRQQPAAPADEPVQRQQRPPIQAELLSGEDPPVEPKQSVMSDGVLPDSAEQEGMGHQRPPNPPDKGGLPDGLSIVDNGIVLSPPGNAATPETAPPDNGRPSPWSNDTQQHSQPLPPPRIIETDPSSPPPGSLDIPIPTPVLPEPVEEEFSRPEPGIILVDPPETDRPTTVAPPTPAAQETPSQLPPRGRRPMPIQLEEN